MGRWRATSSAMAYLRGSIPSPVTAEMGKNCSLRRLAKVVSFLSLSGFGYVGFGSDEDGGLGGEGRARSEGFLARQ